MGALDWLEDKATELVTGRDLDQERAAAAAAAAGNDARSAVYGQQSQLRSDLPYGTDPATITTVDNWASWSHPQIKAMTDQLDSGTMHSTAQGWNDRGTALETDFGTFKSEMAQIVTAGWEGEAATAAQTSTSSYADIAASVGTAARYMGTKVTEAATGAEQTRSMVPEPVSFSVKEGLASTLGGPFVVGADLMKQKNAQNEAHAAAVQVMTSVYTPVYQQSDAGIPSFDASSGTGTPPGAPTPSPTPPGIVVAPSNPAVPGTPPGGVTHHGSSNPSAPSPTGSTTGLSWQPGSGAPSGPSPSGPSSGPGAAVPWPPATPPTSGSAPSPWAAPGGSTSTPAPVSSAGWAPPGAGPVGGSSGYGFGGTGASGPYGPGTPGPGSSGAGGAGGYGSGGAAGGVGGFGAGAGLGSYGAGGSAGAGYRSSGSGGFGSSNGGGGSASGVAGGYGSGPSSTAGPGGGVGAGASGGPGAGAGGTAVGGGAAGARGASGSGMAGGGRGAKGEDDYEHNTPSYLITEENGSELVGELPRVAPAVIGE